MPINKVIVTKKINRGGYGTHKSKYTIRYNYSLREQKGRVVIAGDGQVTLGSSVFKATANKLRSMAGGSIVAGFAGSTADAFALLKG